MTWKLYALVSAGAFVATYLVSGPGPLAQLTHVGPQSRTAATSQTASTAKVESDIQELADRLEAHVHAEVAFRAPTRNPFQFVERPRIVKQVIAPKVIETPPPPVPLPPSVTLSGIAEDRVNGGVQRTAIFSSSTGVTLAREGDTVGGRYRVVSIDQDVVTLETVSDGTTLRLALAKP
ncbi:MAG TPA: hypothetical protein VH436_01835 [Vicinamibacterales bacterium]|jgi:hypothetical protein